MNYPNKSVPYGDTLEHPETLALRGKRILCAAANHHPRSHTGSWCFGYGYVCGRCYMYADPWRDDQIKSTAEAINAGANAGAVCGGGPRT